MAVIHIVILFAVVVFLTIAVVVFLTIMVELALWFAGFPLQEVQTRTSAGRR